MPRISPERWPEISSQPRAKPGARRTRVTIHVSRESADGRTSGTRNPRRLMVCQGCEEPASGDWGGATGTFRVINTLPMIY